MSQDTNLNWFYELVGRNIHLWQYNESSSGDAIIYPDEDITNGLRFEGTAYIKPFVTEAIEDTDQIASGITISFSTTVITGVGTNDGFASGDRVRIKGSASNDGDYTTTDADATTLTTSGLTTEAAGESISIYQIPKEVTSPDESSHVNLSRTLTLAVIDYVKAQKADLVGEVGQKEYYMKEFYRKIGDSQVINTKWLLHWHRSRLQ